jgi:hypothetical protein
MIHVDVRDLELIVAIEKKIMYASLMMEIMIEI